MYVDFKTTVWERIQIPTDLEEEFKKKLISGEIESANEAFGVFGSNIDDLFETLLDTSEQMSPEENDGQSTIELHLEPNETDVIDEIIWDNSIKKKPMQEYIIKPMYNIVSGKPNGS